MNFVRPKQFSKNIIKASIFFESIETANNYGAILVPSAPVSRSPARGLSALCKTDLKVGTRATECSNTRIVEWKVRVSLLKIKNIIVPINFTNLFCLEIIVKEVI